MNNSVINFQTIAVDFDGTLCYSNWPELGQPNQALIAYLQEWKRNGNKLILWTCRAGDALTKAVEWCREHNLEFDAVNDNLPEIIEYYGHNSRKISCDYYIDDRMLLPENAKAQDSGQFYALFSETYSFSKLFVQIYFFLL